MFRPLSPSRDLWSAYEDAKASTNGPDRSIENKIDEIPQRTSTRGLYCPCEKKIES